MSTSLRALLDHAGPVSESLTARGGGALRIGGDRLAGRHGAATVCGGAGRTQALYARVAGESRHRQG